MGLRLLSDARALVPRPETEALVERVLADRHLRALAAPRMADVGTGSGCIVLALAEARKEARLWATDLHAGALELARENARRLAPEASVHWLLGDGLSVFEDRSLDVVVSNPPYIPDTDWAGLAREVRAFEPRTALTAGADGLDVIRSLVGEAPRVLDSRGLLFLECGEEQTGPVEALMRQSGLVGVRSETDLAGRPRIVSGRMPS